MTRIRIDPLDALALIGLVFIAAGVAVRWGADIAAIVVGAAVLAYTILVTRSGGTP